jgi:hypothetical protein
MITARSITALEKDKLPEAAKAIASTELPLLVELLSERDDDIRYKAFLVLRHRSQLSDDVYPFWDTFKSKLKSQNSYQRSIGLMLIADNARWDTENRLDGTIDDYLDLLNDEKPITVRQCIQSLVKIVAHRPDLGGKIAGKLTSFDIMSVKETMRKLVLLDILLVLAQIRKTYNTDEIESVFLRALSGETLDKKTKKQVEKLL